MESDSVEFVNNLILSRNDIQLDMWESARYSKNIVRSSGALQINERNRKNVLSVQGNLFSSSRGNFSLKDPLRINLLENNNAFVQDVFFVNLNNGNFNFIPKSPAVPLGIDSFDFNDAGFSYRFKRLYNQFY